MSGILQIQSNAWAIPALLPFLIMCAPYYTLLIQYMYNTGIHIAFQGVVHMDLGNQSAT